MTKTNIRKRAISILLILMVMLTMTPMTASAADGFVEVSTYEQLKNEVDKGEAKVKLIANIDTTGENGGAGVTNQSVLKFFGNDNILDLNGHTLKLVSNTGATFIYVNKDLTIKDSQGGGRINFEYGPNVMHRTTAIYVSHASNEDIAHLTVESGTLSSTKGGITLIESIGNLTINGGKFYAPYVEGSGGTYAIHTIHQYNDNAKTIITGGEIDGVVRIQRTDSAATGTPNYGDIPVQIKGGTFKQHVQLRWTEKGEPSGYPTEFSPAVEIAGGIFEKRINPIENGLWGTRLSTKLTGGTFKAYTNLGLGKGDSTGTDYKYYLKSLGNSIIMRGNEIRTSCDWSEADWFNASFGGIYGGIYLDGSESTPVTVIPNAWGMKSVTLDGTKTINYAKDWKGAVENMDNSTAHTIKFEWYPLASELVNAGYSYNARCDHYISGSSAVQQTDTIAAGATSHTVTIPAGADPKVYSFALHLNLKKGDNNVGIFSNEHIVKLVVSEAPVAPPTLTGQVYYTSGIVYGSPISIAASVTPAEATKSYQWQRSTDGGSTWTNIEGATSGRYTPVAADMGENVRIRVKVTAEGYLGEIVGAALKVSKAANNNYPEVIKLEAVKNGAGNYTGFKITNFDSDYEYVYSTTDTQNWSANQISSATVTGLTSNTTYYVFARFKETATHTAGSIVSKNSIMLYDYVPLDRVSLEGYDSGNTIYIKKGESVTLKVSADPSNANSWSKITFKDEGATTSNIAISNGTINASTGTATPFPNGHTITITGVSTGSANLRASYPSATSSAYGTWYVVVYDDSTVADALRLENVYAYEDITLSENDEAELPTELPKLLPEKSGYHLEWRILKRGTTGVAHVTENDNIKLEDDKIKPKTAHTGSEKTQLELVAVKDGSTTIKLLAKTSPFYVTVTEAPTVELTGVTVAPTKVNLELNATYQLSAVKEPVNAAGSLTWTSDKPDVAAVSSTGEVTAKAQGTAIITVSCGDKKATCTVTVDHQHDYSGQPYLYLDPGNHYQECTAGDGYNIQAHEFTAWTDNGNGTHSRHCTVCKMTDGSTYTETAEHTWVWVVDQEAALNQPGRQHEECTGCNAKRSENTVIPALKDYAVAVTGGKASDATGATITRAMENATITITAQAPIGQHFVKWVVKAGGVTLANESSATTTFTMPANDVTIEASFEKNASFGGYVPTVQKPEITIIGSGKADLS
ncbi:MAG: InlB B-repeat-containing protein, partial [Clostridia bacterium]